MSLDLDWAELEGDSSPSPAPTSADNEQPAQTGAQGGCRVLNAVASTTASARRRVLRSIYCVGELEVLAARPDDVTVARKYIRSMLDLIRQTMALAGSSTGGGEDSATTTCRTTAAPHRRCATENEQQQQRHPVPSKLAVALWRHNRKAFEALVQSGLYQREYLLAVQST